MHNNASAALLAAIVLLVFVANGVGAQTANVIATVNVFCNFKVSVAPSSSMYVLPLTSDINVGYSILQTNGCLITSMPGFLNVTNQINYLMSSNSVTYPPGNGTVSVPYMIFENITHESYTAELALTYANFTNQSYSVFQIVQPAIMSLNGLFATSGIVENSQVTVYQNINRNGFLAPSNMLLHTTITGPGPTNLEMNVPVASPGLFSFNVGNASSHTGTYLIKENMTYFNGAVNAVTDTSEYNYTVVAPSQSSSGGGGGSALPRSPQNISSVYFTSIPVLSGMIVGASSVSQIGMANKGQYPVWVNLTAPAKSALGSVILSSASLYLQPHTALSVDIAYFINASAAPGSYVIPINVSVTPQGAVLPSKQKLFLMVTAKPKGPQSPQIITSFVLQNSTKATGYIQLVNNLNGSIYNATLEMRIPRSATKFSSISLAGAPSRLFETNNSYVLSWNISNISKGNNFVYYTISNVTNPQLILSPSTTFSVPSREQSLLTVFSISIPTFYVNTTENINIASFYTGIRENNITFTLASISGVRIANASQSFDTLPNTYVNPTFPIYKISKSGTYIFTLFISGDGINQSYSLPVVVVSSSGANGVKTSETLATTIPQAEPQAAINVKGYLAGLPFFGVAIVVLSIVLLVRRRNRSAHYRRERVKDLEELKEHIKRNE